MFFLPAYLSGQNEELVSVKAGTRILDYFPVSKRYLYSDFTTGRIWLKNGTYSDRRLNYNHLAGEIEFIQARDTLAITGRNNIARIIIAQDTFYYDKGYIEQLSSGKIKAGLKQAYKLKSIENKDSYGTTGSGGATSSYSSMPVNGNFYKLTANKDLIFQRSVEYYISAPGSGFLSFTKKNMFKLFPREKARIKAYLDSGNINFKSREDLLKLTAFLNSL